MRIQFTIDDDLGQELQKKANELGFSVSSYVRHIIKTSSRKKNLVEQGLKDIQSGRVEEVSLEKFKSQLGVD